MDKATALALWESLEAERITDLEGDPPLYEVRLDATTDRDDERIYRVRVTGTFAGFSRDSLLFVMKQAGEHEVDLTVQNTGVELS